MDSTLKTFMKLVYEKAVYSYGFDFAHLDILLIQRFKRYFFSHRKSERRKLRDFSRNINDRDRDIFYASAIKQIKKLIPINSKQENSIKIYLGNLIFIMADIDDPIDIEQLDGIIYSKFPEIKRIADEIPKIENYQIVEEFSRSENINVYKAINNKDQRRFITTIKIDSEFDFEEKFTPLEYIFSPYLLKYMSCGITKKNKQKYFWFSTEYDTCCTLRDIIETRIANGKTIDGNRLMIFSQGMLRGLNEIHKNSCFHGILNPDNILVNYKNYDIKMKDYAIYDVVDGHARIEEDIKNYLAPEQIDNLQNSSTNSDIFAFGVILYEMFTNEYPFIKGNKSRKTELYKDGIPFELMSFFKSALDKNPLKRFQKASEASKAFKDPANEYLKRIRRDEDMPKILEIFENQILQKYALHHRGEITQKQIYEFIDYCVQKNISAVSEERLREILPGIFSQLDSLDDIKREIETKISANKEKDVSFDEEELSKLTRQIKRYPKDDARRKKMTNEFKKMLEEDIDVFLTDEEESKSD